MSTENEIVEMGGVNYEIVTPEEMEDLIIEDLKAGKIPEFMQVELEGDSDE